MLNSVRSRIFLLVALPLLAAMWFMGNAITDRYRLVQDLDAMAPLSQLSIRIGALVHETQKERGATGVFLGSDRTRFSSELKQQRQLTNTQAVNFTNNLDAIQASNYGSEFQQILNTASQKLSGINKIRTAVDNNSIKTGAALTAYTQHNTAMLALAEQIVELTTNAEIAQRRSAHINFMQGKERAGIERAIMSNTFALNRFEQGVYHRFAELVTIQDTYFKIFMSVATSEQKRFFSQQMNDPAIAKVQAMRDIAFNKGENASKLNKLAELYQTLSFAGPVTKLKDAIIKADFGLLSSAQQDFTVALKLTQQLLQLDGLTAQDRNQLQIIKTTLDSYLNAIQLVDRNLDIATTASELNAYVNVDATAANQALYALSQSFSNGDFNVDPGVWFKTITTKINQMYKIENKLTDDLSNHGQKLRDAAQLNLILLLVSAIAITLVVIVTVLAVMRGISRPLANTVQFAENIAKGDLTSKLDIERDDELGQLAKALNAMSTNLAQLIQQIGDSANTLSFISSDINNSTEDLSCGVIQQKEQTTQAASSVEEMSVTVNLVATQCHDAALTAESARQQASDGGKIVIQTIESIQQTSAVVHKSAEVVNELGRRSEEVGNVVNVIDEIANQTNLLALNAAIEAARAGESGRGFAVVADEVRQLAARTTQATSDVTKSITEIQQITQSVVSQMQVGTEQVIAGEQLAEQAGLALEQIVETSKVVTEAVQSIAQVTNEQATAASEIAESVENIHQVTQQSVTISEQSGDAVARLNTCSQELKVKVGNFTLA